MILTPILMAAGITLYAANANALIAVRAIELPASDLKPVVAVELAPPSLAPVAAHELTAIAAIELTPATLTETEQGEDKVYNSAQAKTVAAPETPQVAIVSENQPHTRDANNDAAELQSTTTALPAQKAATTSDYNPAVY